MPVGEIGFVTDTQQVRIGDGATNWITSTNDICPEVSSFAGYGPGSRVFRTDLGLEFRNNGMAWYSTAVFQMQFSYRRANSGYTSTGGQIYMPIPFLGVYDMIIDSVDFAMLWSATANWTISLSSATSANIYTTIASTNFTTGGANTVNTSRIINPPNPGATAVILRSQVDEISGFANVEPSVIVNYRLGV